MNIEKLTNNNVDIAHPGILDILYGNTANYYMDCFSRDVHLHHGKHILSELSDLGVSTGNHFGTQGIDYKVLLSNGVDYPYTIFEICPKSYANIPAGAKKLLNKHYNIIVHDYMEGGFTLTDINDVSTVTGEISDVPVFMLFTLLRSWESDNVLPEFPNKSNKKLAIIPVHKPREHRLEALHQIDQAGLLDQCDWSLFLTQNETVPGDFVNGPNVSVDRWSHVVEHSFISKYRSQLPKILDHIESFADCLPLNKKYHGGYNWMVVCETYPDNFFVTEKTIKAFIGGIMPLIVGAPGFVKHLTEFGFKLVDGYDHLSDSDRIGAIVDIMQHDHANYADLAEHNYNLITNQEAISSKLAHRILTAYQRAIND